ncbi:MAG: hypothetical protein O3B87_02625 [bacterium]|nr:hypothetical protein [bacterium]
MRPKTPRHLYILIIVLVGLYSLFKLYQLVSQSLFGVAPDRINIVLYGPETFYYSLDRANNRDYAIAFQPDLKIDVPGGYGMYRVGSLGKLADLDDDPNLIKNTFSLTTTTFVHYVFSNNTNEVYYGEEIPVLQKPALKKILFEPSNASVLDRIYLVLMLLGDSASNYQPISFIEQKEAIFDDISFENELFFDESIGLLFQETYRDEHASIQILYTGTYATASRISDLLEGNGIRVSDISYDIDSNTNCMVIYSADNPSQTARDLGTQFGCTLRFGKTDVYDILFILGEIEQKWKVKNK